MAKHFSDEERARIKERLFDSGLALFETNGLKKTNIEDLARTAGISKGAFYSFFKSKGDFLVLLYQRERNIAHEQCRQMFDRHPKQPVDVPALVGGYARAMRLLMDQRPILGMMYDIYGLDLFHEEKANESLVRYNREINGKISGMIQNWMDQSGEYSISSSVVAEMVRSLDYLRYHLVGYESFHEVVEKFTVAIERLIASSKVDE